jgi:hypothetical protein
MIAYPRRMRTSAIAGRQVALARRAATAEPEPKDASHGAYWVRRARLTICWHALTLIKARPYGAICRFCPPAELSVPEEIGPRDA